MGTRLQLRLPSDTLTREWRKGEAGKGQGSRGTPPPGRRCVIKGPPLGPDWEYITRPDTVAPWGRRASSTRHLKPQTSNLKPPLRAPLCGGWVH